MNRNPVPVVTLANAKKMLFAISCCVLLMLLAAPTWAQDQCTPANPADDGGPACGVVITITGTSGHLVATLSGSGTANNNPYDGVGGDDELIGIQNNTGVDGVGAVTIGAIRLSAPPTFAIPFIVECTSGGQVCSPPFSTNVTVMPGPITVTYTASPNHCSAVEVQVSVDGTVVSTSAFLNAGQSTGPIVTSPLSAGPHTVALQATGEVGGCNDGTLFSWGGTLALSGNVTAPAGSVPISNLFAFDGDGACNFFKLGGCGPTGYEGPNNTFTGISPDFTTGTVHFTNPIRPGGSTWFAMEGTPVMVVSVGETQPLAIGVTNVFPFGPFVCTSGDAPVCTAGNGTWTEWFTGDDIQFTPLSPSPLNGPGADFWTILAIPVPAGPLGIGPFGGFGFGEGEYGIETPGATPYGPPLFSSPTFPNWPCTAYTDYSKAAAVAAGLPLGEQPTCVEIERDFIGNATDAANLIAPGQLDYDLDENSIPSVIGGPHVLWAPGVTGPTSSPGSADFSSDAISAYTGATPVLESTLILPTGVDPPPAKVNPPPGGHSVIASAFDPLVSETKPILAGVTVGFPGLEKPVINTGTPSCSPNAPVNCILDFVPVALSWDQTDISGNAITNLHSCRNVAGGACTTKGVTTPWVYLYSIPVTGCPAGFAGQNPLPGVLLNLSRSKEGEYTFVWEPLIEPDGCEVRVVLEFGTGSNAAPTLSYQAPAVFEYTDDFFFGVL
jgi:hypothetical protein